MNSFPKPDQAVLERIREPLRIEAHLAAEDPRRVDLERQALSKLRRVLPKVQVQYIANTSTGLFEQTSQHYGEIWYDLGGRRAMSRMTTAEGVLETIYSLAGVTPPERRRRDLPRASARGPAEARGRGVLRHLAGAGRGRRNIPAQEACSQNEGSFHGRWRMTVLVVADGGDRRPRPGRGAEIRTSRSISARRRSASRPRRSSRWSARGSSRRTAPTR